MDYDLKSLTARIEPILIGIVGRSWYWCWRWVSSLPMWDMMRAVRVSDRVQHLYSLMVRHDESGARPVTGFSIFTPLMVGHDESCSRSVTGSASSLLLWRDMMRAVRGQWRYLHGHPDAARAGQQRTRYERA